MVVINQSERTPHVRADYSAERRRHPATSPPWRHHDVIAESAWRHRWVSNPKPWRHRQYTYKFSMKLDRPIHRGHKRPTAFHFLFVFAIRCTDFVLRSYLFSKWCHVKSRQLKTISLYKTKNKNKKQTIKIRYDKYNEQSDAQQYSARRYSHKMG